MNSPTGSGDNDIQNGGARTDTASYASAATCVIAPLSTEFVPGENSDVFSCVENLTGTAGANGPNVLKGLGGNDTVNGGARSKNPA